VLPPFFPVATSPEQDEISYNGDGFFFPMDRWGVQIHFFFSIAHSSTDDNNPTLSMSDSTVTLSLVETCSELVEPDLFLDSLVSITGNS